MTKKRKILLTSAVTLATTIGLGVAVAGSVFAQSSANSDSFISKVAALVGIDQTKLKTAISTVSKDQIAQDVKDGKITQAQADKMIANIDSGKSPIGGMGVMRGGRDGMMGAGMKQIMTDVAKFLGTDEASLRTLQESGKTLKQIAIDKGKSVDNLTKLLKTDFEKNLATAVTDGKITQTEADKIKANEDKMLDRILNQTRPTRGEKPADAPEI